MLHLICNWDKLFISQGVQGRLDKKSLMRIIQRLATQGQIKSIKTLLKFGSEEKELHFLADPSISADDQIVKSAIEAAKMRHVALSKELTQEVKSRRSSTDVSRMDPPIAHNPDYPNYALLKSLLKTEDMHYDSEAGRRYGYAPRMKRHERVHQFLW